MKLAHYVAEVGKPASGYIARPASKKNYVGNFQKPTKDNAYSFTVGQSVFSYLVTGADRASNFVSASDPTITIRDTDVLVFDVNVDAPSKPFSLSLTETGTIVVPEKHTLLNNAIDSGLVKFYPGIGNTGTYYYRATNDTNFKGTINVTGNPTHTAVLSGALVVPSSSNLSGTTKNNYFHALITNTNANDIVYTWSLSGATGNASGVAYGRKYRLETTNRTGLFGQTETFYVNVNVSSTVVNTGITNSGIVKLNHLALATVPAQVSGLSISSGTSNTLNLSWTAPSDGGFPIRDYIIKVGQTGVGGTGLGDSIYVDGTGTSTSGSITGLVNGSHYFFSVAATNDLGTGLYSASGNSRPAAIPNQISAASVIYTTGNAQFSFSWTAPLSNGSPIRDYIIKYSGQNAGGPLITFNDGVSTANSGTITGVINGSGYFTTIAAINSIGTGVFSTLKGPVVPSG